MNIGPWNPDGSKIYFGKLKNVSIDRTSKNDYEYLKNRSEPIPFHRPQKNEIEPE